jgi:hypothetical protein
MDSGASFGLFLISMLGKRVSCLISRSRLSGVTMWTRISKPKLNLSQLKPTLASAQTILIISAMAGWFHCSAPVFQRKDVCLAAKDLSHFALEFFSVFVV